MHMIYASGSGGGGEGEGKKRELSDPSHHDSISF